MPQIQPTLFISHGAPDILISNRTYSVIPVCLNRTGSEHLLFPLSISVRLTGDGVVYQ